LATPSIGGFAQLLVGHQELAEALHAEGRLGIFLLPLVQKLQLLGRIGRFADLLHYQFVLLPVDPAGLLSEGEAQGQAEYE
jgi:hypothetical protein